ncbi:MAG: hypothetical protein JXA23_04655 [Bacteroidales bacterium]|nr:hypothetical protein [Bacteroidales bacterium]
MNTDYSVCTLPMGRSLVLFAITGFLCGVFCCFSIQRLNAQVVDTAVIGTIKRISAEHKPHRQVARFCRIAGSRLNGSDGYARVSSSVISVLQKFSI